MAMTLPKQEGKKLLQLVRGNVIAEIGGKNFVAIVAIVAMSLLKMGGKKKNSGCQNLGRN